MDEKEICELKEAVDALHKKLKKENNSGIQRFIIGTFAIFLITLIFYSGFTYRDIQILKENSIPNADWLDNEAKTSAVYNKVFKIPSEYTTRGGLIKK